MADGKILDTRIKLRYDSYENWISYNSELLDGEVAIAYLTTTAATNPQNGDIQHPVLFKVGHKKADGSLYKFNELPWGSALAADVYSWAKKSESEFLEWLDKQFSPTINKKTQTQLVIWEEDD